MRRHFARPHLESDPDLSSSSSSSSDSDEVNSVNVEGGDESHSVEVTTIAANELKEEQDTYSADTGTSPVVNIREDQPEPLAKEEIHPEETALPAASSSSSSSDLETNSDSDSSSNSDTGRSKQNKKPRFVRARKQEGNLEWENPSRKHDTLLLFQRAVRPTNTPEIPSNLDDTDGIDPKGEYRAWVDREKRRMNREHAKLAEHEEHLMEIEEIRLLREAKRKKDSEWSD